MASAQTRLTPTTATTTSVSELYLACRNGDIATVERLLPNTSLVALNRLEPNGSTCLHAACYYGHKEIARQLLARGTSRRIINKYQCTPLDEAKDQEIIDLFPRSTQAAQERFAPETSEQRLEWTFSQDQAEAYSRATHLSCIKDRGVKETVKKIMKADILLPDDMSKETELVRFFLRDAEEHNDPIPLLKAYTAESVFYRTLNKTMASGKDREVFEKLRRKWTGYYTGFLVRNPAFANYRFAGETFRGMRVTQADLAQYAVGVALTNKAFQSTSKSWKIAKGFAYPATAKPDTIPVILIFSIKDPTSAIRLDEISEYQNEEEVLIIPGTMFIVIAVDKNETPYEIKLEQLVWTD